MLRSRGLLMDSDLCWWTVAIQQPMTQISQATIKMAPNIGPLVLDRRVATSSTTVPASRFKQPVLVISWLNCNHRTGFLRQLWLSYLRRSRGSSWNSNNRRSSHKAIKVSVLSLFFFFFNYNWMNREELPARFVELGNWSCLTPLTRWPC